MDRTHSEPLPRRRVPKPVRHYAEDTEKENMGAGMQSSRPPLTKRTSSSGAAKPPRMRRTRSELHGPCCHCGAAGEPRQPSPRAGTCKDP